MRIAISGLSGCGNTTACKNVAKELGLQFVNYTFRDMAPEMNCTLEQLQLLAKKNPEVDYYLDNKLIHLIEANNKCVVGTRLAGWLFDADLRVWLHASLEERARRIAQREGKPLREVIAATDKRDKQNIARYKKYYGVNTLDHEDFDLVVNTERLTPEQVAALIVAAAKLAQQNNLKHTNPHAAKIKQIITKKLSGQKAKKLGLPQ